MGKRLTKIYTRTGDGGDTGLADGSRVPKNSARIEAMGAVDELNSSIGMLLCEALPKDTRKQLLKVQNDLFDLGGELSVPGHPVLKKARIATLEQTLDHYNADLPPLQNFILPGGSRAASAAHVARTVCRRAERRVVALGAEAPPLACPYLNRLSDLLFVLSRVLNRVAGEPGVPEVPEVLWQQTRK